MNKLPVTRIAFIILAIVARAPDSFAKESPSAAKAVTERPNIVFLFSDDHAIKTISAYGSVINKTPNIDRIAREGVLFRNNFCANSICAPSRASILTGKHSHKNGQLGNHSIFDGSQLTYPQLLKSVGYQTAIFGKWHLKSDPTGFDEWMVYPDQGDYYNPDYLTPEGKKRLTGYSVDVTTDLALDYLKRRKKDAPFMLMCQYKAPHRNWMPAPEYLNLFEDVTIPEPETLFDDYSNRAGPLAHHRMGIDKHMHMYADLKVSGMTSGESKEPQRDQMFEWMNEWMGRMTEEQRLAWDKAYGPKNTAFKKANLKGRELVSWKYQRYIKDYLRCVQAVDDNVGRILKYLDDNGLAENTIVIYSSDQGFYLGEHGWFDKRWMFEESFRMPLVMRWPGKAKPGTVIEQLTQNIDFAPTLLQAAGVDIPDEIQGASMVPLIEKRDVEWRDALYYHYYQHGGHGVVRHYGIRTDRYKLIHYYTSNEWDLMDLERDPNELQSFYNDPEYKGIREELHAKLAEIKKKYGNPYDHETKDPDWAKKEKK